jgi:hypothetical protein
MTVVVFLSTVSDEFRAYRDQLVHDLTRHNVAVKVQEDLKDLGGNMLDKLNAYIAHCDAVVIWLATCVALAPTKRNSERKSPNTLTFRANCRRLANRSEKVCRFPTRTGRLGSPSITAKRCDR